MQRSGRWSSQWSICCESMRAYVWTPRTHIQMIGVVAALGLWWQEDLWDPLFSQPNLLTSSRPMRDPVSVEQHRRWTLVSPLPHSYSTNIQIKQSAQKRSNCMWAKMTGSTSGVPVWPVLISRHREEEYTEPCCHCGCDAPAPTLQRDFRFHNVVIRSVEKCSVLSEWLVLLIASC